MQLRAQNFLLGLAALICFVDAFAAQGEDPGPALTAVLGILLIRRALVLTPQSQVVLVAGYALTALVVAGNHSVVNINKPLWIVVTVVAFVFFGWWERIVKLCGRVG